MSARNASALRRIIVYWLHWGVLIVYKMVASCFRPMFLLWMWILSRRLCSSCRLRSFSIFPSIVYKGCLRFWWVVCEEWDTVRVDSRVNALPESYKLGSLGVISKMTWSSRSLMNRIEPGWATTSESEVQILHPDGSLICISQTWVESHRRTFWKCSDKCCAGCSN